MTKLIEMSEAKGQGSIPDSNEARSSTPKLQSYLELSYPMELYEEEGAFTASYPDLPGCISFGSTPDEAVAELKKVKELWIAGRLAADEPIPKPSELEEFSGKFVLRIPKALHKSLDFEAQRQGVSLNHYVSTLLAQRHQSNIELIDYSRIADLISHRLREDKTKSRYARRTPAIIRRFRTTDAEDVIFRVQFKHSANANHQAASRTLGCAKSLYLEQGR